MSEKDSYDYIADAVRAYWKNTSPRNVVVFFWQKYSYKDDWECHEEVAFCDSDSDYETVSFLNDFCEGQTCVKDITVVPLSEVTEYYAKTKLNEQEPVLSHEDADRVPHCGSCGWVQSYGCNYCDNCGKPLRWE